MAQDRSPAADIAEALNRHGRVLQVEANQLGRLDHRVDAAARGRVAAAQRAEQMHRFAGDDARQMPTGDDFVFVHHPGHHIGRGVDIGRGHILVGTDEVGHSAHVAAAEAFKLAARHALGVADHAALAAAQRDVHHRGLPGHPRGQRPDRVDGFIGMEANAAFRGAAGIIVLHAKALESLIAAIIHQHGDAEMQLAHRHAQESVHGR